MKKMRKIFAVLLTLAMVLAMSIPTFAKDANNNPTITINHASTNAKFAIKKLVKADPTKETGWTFETGIYDNYFKDNFSGADEQTIIKAMISSENSSDEKGQEMEGFATKYANALKAVYNGMDATAPATAESSPISITGGVGVYFVKGYEEGYTYNPMAAYIKFGTYNTETGVPGDPEDAVIDAKRIKQSITKSAESANHVTSIGKTEGFHIDSEIPFIPTTDSNRKYILNDTITGATYTTVAEGEHADEVELTVTIGSGNDIVNKTFYGTVTTNNENRTQSMTADLSSLLDGNNYANKSVRIAYTALVTKVKVGNDAEMGDGENTGTTKFGSDHEDLFTGSLIMTKYDQKEDKTLAGAGFKVKKDDVTLKFTKESDGVYTLDPTNGKEEVVTGSDGTVTVKGLECGKYTMTETTAPNGYSLNKDVKDFEIKLVAGKTTAEKQADVVNGVNSIKDSKLSALPSTGGIGTTIFTIAGCLIMVTAAGLFFASRKKANK